MRSTGRSGRCKRIKPRSPEFVDPARPLLHTLRTESFFIPRFEALCRHEFSLERNERSEFGQAGRHSIRGVLKASRGDLEVLLGLRPYPKQG